MSAVIDNLYWPDIKVSKIKITETAYRVECEPSAPPTHCPHCKHGKIWKRSCDRTGAIRDIPIKGRYVLMYWLSLRFMCAGCKKEFYIQNPYKNPHHKITNRLIKMVKELQEERSMNDLRRLTGLNWEVVRTICENDYAEYC